MENELKFKIVYSPENKKYFLETINYDGKFLKIDKDFLEIEEQVNNEMSNFRHKIETKPEEIIKGVTESLKTIFDCFSPIK